MKGRNGRFKPRHVMEGGDDAVVHRIRKDFALANYQGMTVCGIGFYFVDHRHLWQEPPKDHPWWHRVGVKVKVTCLGCLAGVK